MKIKPVKRLEGEIALPGDKSISHRAIMIGSLAEGLTRIENFVMSDDCKATLEAFRKLGVKIEKQGDAILVNGRGLRGLGPPKSQINLGGSGTSMRLLLGVLAGQPFEAKLVGNKSLSKRPMKRVIEPLRLMGADISGEQNDEYPPLIIHGGELKPIEYTTKIASAQVKSAILLAGLYAEGITKVTEPVKSRDHTERMLAFFGADIDVKGLTVELCGRPKLKGKNIILPADISSAAFFIVGAILIKNSKITVKAVGLNPTRTGFIDVLLKMGAKLEIYNVDESLKEPVGDISAAYSSLKGVTIEKRDFVRSIDELPILMVAASFALGRTVIKGASELRVKETDRINSMVSNLKRMGVDVNVAEDEIVINGGKELNSANLSSFGDHRTAMSMVVAGMAAKGQSTIDEVKCISKSFPQFFEILHKLKRDLGFHKIPSPQRGEGKGEGE